jgi:signal transduction histidine kinase
MTCSTSRASRPGKIKLQREPTLLADIVSNAVEANRAALDAARVTLQVSIPNRPIILDVDRTRMVQVLSNCCTTP